MTVSAPFLTGDQRSRLAEEGYLVLPDFMPPDMLAAMRERIAVLQAEEGEHAGREFKPEPGALRLANCVDKGEVFRAAIAMPAILEAVGVVLGADFKLSSLNVRTALPHNGERQPLHRDMGALPDERGDWVCNCIWMLDDFTLENGPTRAVPRTHRLRHLPDDPKASHPDEILITGRAGTVVVMNAHLWHGGEANRTDRPRTALHSFYCRSDKPQQQYQKRLLSPATQAGLSPALRRLLALDDPRNDELSAEVAVTSGFLK